MKRIILVLIAMAITALSGCAGMTKEDFGKLGGAGIGALLGNQIGEGSGKIAATVIGGIVGYWAGGKIGSTMDENDRLRMDQAAEHQIYAPRYGTYRDQWKNPSTQTTYATSVTTVPMPQDRYSNCLERKRFTQYVDVYIDGKRERAERTGVACRDARTGNWSIEEGQQ